MSKKEKREKENLKKLVKFEKNKKNETTRERKRNLKRRTGAKKVEEIKDFFGVFNLLGKF